MSAEQIDRKKLKRSVKKSKLVEIQLSRLNYFSQKITDNTDSESDDDQLDIDFEINKDSNYQINNEKMCISCKKFKNYTLFNRFLNNDTIKDLNNYHSNITSKQDESILFNYLISTNSKNQASSNRNNNSFLIIENSSEYLTNYTMDSMNQNKLSFERINNQEKSINNEQFKFKVEKLCNKCWIYWKKYGEFKYTYHSEASLNKNMNLERPCPEKRQDRLNAIRSQLNYKCFIDNCNKEFKFKEDFINHSLICHCLLVKQALLNAKSKYQYLHNFYLRITPFNKAICNFYNKIDPKYFKSLARHPFKVIADGNSILNECK